VNFIKYFLFLTFIFAIHITTQATALSESKELSSDEQLPMYQKVFAPYQNMHQEGKFDISTTEMPELETILETAMGYVKPVVSEDQRVRFETSCVQVKENPLTLLNFYAFHFLLANIIDESLPGTPLAFVPAELYPLLASLGFIDIIKDTFEIFSRDSSTFADILKDFDKSILGEQLKASQFPFLAVLYRPSGQIPIRIFNKAFTSPEGAIDLAALPLKTCGIHGGILRTALAFLLHDFLHKHSHDENLAQPADFATIQNVLGVLDPEDRLMQSFRFYISREIELKELAIDGDPKKLFLNMCAITEDYMNTHLDLDHLFQTALKKQLETFISKSLGKGFRFKTEGLAQAIPNTYSAKLSVLTSHQPEPFFSLAMTAIASEIPKDGNHTVRIQFQMEGKNLADIADKMRVLQDGEFFVPGHTYLRRFYIEDFVKLLHFMDPQLKNTLSLDVDPVIIRETGLAMLKRFKTAGLAQIVLRHVV